MKFYSRGKLLISGEYLVLKGAKALVAPLHRGQSLFIENTAESQRLRWSSLENGRPWFTAEYDSRLFEILNASDTAIGKRLQNILRKTRLLNPAFCNPKQGLQVTTDLDFDRNWGFGSSSTLISNIARWAGVDAFALHGKVSRGSGYDVIAATLDGPAHYTLLGKAYTVEEVPFNPGFSHRLFFIYLGNKQDSARVTQQFLLSKKKYRVECRTISELSQLLAEAPTLADFEYYLREHDMLMASVLKQPRLKDQMFTDLKGEIKPLGAWGGDFAMITWNDAANDLEKYLETKKIKTFFGFEELIKNK